MSLDENIKAIYKMKKHPGIVVKGANRAGAEKVFEEITHALHYFYEQKDSDLIMPTQLFEGKREYNFPVFFISSGMDIKTKYFYNKEKEEMDMETTCPKPKQYGMVNVSFDDTYKDNQWNGDGLGYFKIEKDTIFVYFNTWKQKGRGKDNKASFNDRDEFLKYVSNQTNSVKISA